MGRPARFCRLAATAALVNLVQAVPSTITSLDQQIELVIDTSGITSFSVKPSTNPSGKRWTAVGEAGSGLTILGGGTINDLSPTSCAQSGQATTHHDDNQNQTSVSQQWSCSVNLGEEGMQHVDVTTVDTFSADIRSVKLTTEITTSNGSLAFTVPIQNRFSISSQEASLLHWLPWGKGCVVNDGYRSTCGNRPWQNPLVPESLPNSTVFYRYGALGRNASDVFTVPIVTLLDVAYGAGVSVALDVDDPLLEIGLTVDSGGFNYRRELLRLGQNRTVRFNQHFVGHEADWRSGLRYFTGKFPEYFYSSVPNIADFEGLGSYTWDQQPYNASRARLLGFKTNWDLSGTFMPYDGNFLPYEEKWLNLGPINSGLAQYNVTYDMIIAYYKQIQEEGFHSLSYFDIGNWGTRTNTNYRGPNLTCGVRPNGDPAPCATPDGGNSYLVNFLWQALLHHGWTITGGRFMVHHYDWVGTTDMDTMEPCFEDILIEQAERHIIKLGDNFEGIAIDRLDYSEAFNYDRDDNISWVPLAPQPGADTRGNWPHPLTNWTWGPARALRLSYRHTYERLHKVLHGGSKPRVIMNNCNGEGNVCRIDLLKNFDGTFSEGSALNPVAFTGLATPTIVWTYGLSDDIDLLHAYFQQHLLMNAYPMAPMPLNDHSIQPGSVIVEQAYAEYAPLFNAMHGARWFLSANPVNVVVDNVTAASAKGSVDSPSYNIFTLQTSSNSSIPPDLLVPIMLANSTSIKSVNLGINLGPAEMLFNWPRVAAMQLSALYPGGNGNWKQLGSVNREGDMFSKSVPLANGCAFVKATLTI